MNNPAPISRPGLTPGRFISALALAAALAACLIGGCKKQPAAEAGPAATYEVRGLITRLPDPRNAATNLSIHHEAIPTFTVKGKVVGMAEMTMPFPTAPELSLSGIAVGDPVRFVMEVREKPRMTYQITKISKLPADTKLDLKAPPEAGPGTDPTPPK
ncbi:MAG: copper-binding protein [Phycisphaerales bacterium]|nr:copper-binding protein [Phycisphaerales bacterium]